MGGEGETGSRSFRASSSLVGVGSSSNQQRIVSDCTAVKARREITANSEKSWYVRKRKGRLQ